jgi:serine/threonine-protein kinase RsbW
MSDSTAHTPDAPSSDKKRMFVDRPAAGWVELTAPSREEYLDRIGVLLDRLAGTHLSKEARDDVRLAVTEIVSNAMEWGNQGDERRRVRVSYGLFDNEVVFKVEDEGEGFDPEDVPDATQSPLKAMRERQESGKRLGGYGIFVARKLMDRMMYNERGNVVILAKRLSGPGDAEPAGTS